MDYAKAFGCVDHNKLWNILKEMGIADHLTCLLRKTSAADAKSLQSFPTLCDPCFCFIDDTKAFDWVDHNKLENC